MSGFSTHERGLGGRHFLTFIVAAALLAACAPDRESPQPSAGFDVSAVVEVVDDAGASMGSVSLDVSCSEQASPEVSLGLALLHNMTYAEAARTFERATRTDPDCAIARWGVAMSYVHPLWPDVPTPEQLEAGWALLQEARALGTATPPELAYITALEAYYRDAGERSEPARLATFAEAWENVSTTYPADAEAALFSALTTVAITAGSPALASRRIEAGAVAERVLEAIPDHPGAHHYVIHAYDIPSAAERALPVANSYGAVAPANSHALHMTSHIFTRRGLWEESIDYNARAADAAWAEPIEGRTSHHHLHAVDYLAYAHLQRGDDEAARETLQHLRTLDGPVVDNAASAYALAAVPARFALERHDWEAAAALQARSPETIGWDAYPHLEAIPVFANALGAAHVGDLASARRSAARLAELAEAAARVSGAYDWATQVRIQEIGARAWIAHAEGRSAEALSLMREAADLEATTEKNPVTPGEVLPAGELLGDMLRAAGQDQDAFNAFARAMERTPNRFNSLYGAARAAESAGMTDAAREQYRRLLAVAGESQTRHAELAHARAFLAGG